MLVPPSSVASPHSLSTARRVPSAKRHGRHHRIAGLASVLFAGSPKAKLALTNGEDVDTPVGLQADDTLENRSRRFSETHEFHEFHEFHRLHAAIVKGCPVEVHRVLAAGGTHANNTAFGGLTSLHKAAFLGNLGVVQTLLRQAAAVDMRDSAGETALHVAASHWQPQIVQVLLRARARADATDKERVSPARAAVARCHRQATDLHKLGLCLDAIMKACDEDVEGCRRRLDLLPQKPSTARQSVNDIRKSGVSISSESELFSRVQAEDVSRDPGLPMGSPTGTMLRPRTCLPLGDAHVVPLLTRAARCGDVDAVKRLLRHHSTINKFDQHGQTALHAAALAVEPSVLNLLIKLRANTTATDFEGLTPLRSMIKQLHWSDARLDPRRLALVLNPLLLEEEHEMETLRREVYRQENAHHDRVAAQFLDAGVDPYLPVSDGWVRSTDTPEEPSSNSLWSDSTR